MPDFNADHVTTAASGGMAGLLVLAGERLLKYMRRDRAEAKESGALAARVNNLETLVQETRDDVRDIRNWLMGQQAK